MWETKRTKPGHEKLPSGRCRAATRHTQCAINAGALVAQMEPPQMAQAGRRRRRRSRGEAAAPEGAPAPLSHPHHLVLLDNQRWGCAGCSWSSASLEKGAQVPSPHPSSIWASSVPPCPVLAKCPVGPVPFPSAQLARRWLVSVLQGMRSKKRPHSALHILLKSVSLKGKNQRVHRKLHCSPQTLLCPAEYGEDFIPKPLYELHWMSSGGCKSKGCCTPKNNWCSSPLCSLPAPHLELAGCPSPGSLVQHHPVSTLSASSVPVRLSCLL